MPTNPVSACNTAMLILIATVTAMERADILGRLRGIEHNLPQIFKQAEKSTQGEIIYSLIDHDPSNRPGSSQLLASEQIPGEVESDKVGREVLRYIHEGSYRKQLVAGLFLKPDELQACTVKPGDSMHTRSALADCSNPDDDRDYYPMPRPQELTFDMKDRSNSADDLLMRSSVKDQITSIFRRHVGPLRYLSTSFTMLESTQLMICNKTFQPRSIFANSTYYYRAPYRLKGKHCPCPRMLGWRR